LIAGRHNFVRFVRRTLRVPRAHYCRFNFRRSGPRRHIDRVPHRGVALSLENGPPPDRNAGENRPGRNQPGSIPQPAGRQKDPKLSWQVGPLPRLGCFWSPCATSEDHPVACSRMAVPNGTATASWFHTDCTIGWQDQFLSLSNARNRHASACGPSRPPHHSTVGMICISGTVARAGSLATNNTASANRRLAAPSPSSPVEASPASYR